MNRIIPFLPLLLLACGPETTPDSKTPPEFEVIATVSHDGLEADLLAQGDLHVGRNVVRYDIRTTGGEHVHHATLKHETTMHMHEHSHSSPSVDPNADGEGEIVFTMASGDMGTWDISLTVSREGAADVTLVFESVDVAVSDARKDLTVGERNYFVTLNFDSSLAVGQNPFVLTVHEVAMHDYPPVETLDITVTPEMPGMGHGSPNNVNPVHEANGNYKGSINLTMPGRWDLAFDLGELGTVTYKIEF